MNKPVKKPPSLLRVTRAWHLTPNMIRVTLTGDRLGTFSAACAGANCKLFLPDVGQDALSFATQLKDGPRPTVRTYTVRHARPELQEIDIDFVDHGDAGPASAWARLGVANGAGFCGFAGPGLPKMTYFEADFYVLAADMSALPVVAAALEAMPRTAKGVAFIEVTSETDRQHIDAPEGVDLRWLLHSKPSTSSHVVPDLIKSLAWEKGRVQTCIAGESGVIKEVRQFLHVEKGLAKDDAYISGYWKIGLVEDEHQKLKRLAAGV